MSATAADVARFTTDGVLITSPQDPAVSAAIAAAHIDAIDGATDEIEMPFDNPAHAQILLDERFAIQRQVNATHLGIEVAETIGIGDTIAIAPVVPTFQVQDDSTNLRADARLRAFAHDMNTDRFSVEVMS